MLLPHRYLSQVGVRIRWAWLKTKELHTLKRLQILSRLHWLKCSCLSQSLGSPRFVSGGWSGLVGLLSFPGRPWSDNILTGGYAGGALISDRWVLTAGRNLFAIKYRQDSKKKKTPLVPKVYLGISKRTESVSSTEVAVEKISKNTYRTFGSLLSKFFKKERC